jgi:hypothetical protein
MDRSKASGRGAAPQAPVVRVEESSRDRVAGGASLRGRDGEMNT